MSKFLKFIVHFVVICTILCVVALAVPPFYGITTQIMDDSSKDTNLPMGSVTYAIPVKTEEAAIGDMLLVQENSAAYKYEITSMDTANRLFTVIDSTVPGSENLTVSVKDYVPKVVATVPFLGYLLVATESIEGLIVLGLAVLFLIILYVIAELWKKEPEDAYEEDPEPGYVKSKKELKREEKERERLYREEERQIKKEDKQRKKKGKKIRTGGFVDEIYEDDLEPEAEEQQPVTVQRATSEAHELLKKEIAAATAEEPFAETEVATAEKTVPAAEQVKEKAEEQNKEEVSEELAEPVEIKKMAVPLLSAAQLAEEAKRRGDAPEIIRDDITKITLFDYSDIIAEDMQEETEE